MFWPQELSERHNILFLILIDIDTDLEDWDEQVM